MTVETIEVTPTLRILIEYDQDPQNPRTDYDPVGEIVYTSIRYCLGDRQVSHDAMDEIRDDIAAGNLIGIPVFAYIHSGTILKAAETNPFSCPWDSGQCGYAYMTPAEAIKEWGVQRMGPKVKEKALAYLKGEVDTLSAYLGGEVYGYVIERLVLDEDGDITDTEVLDSCWGFIGDVSYVCQEALAAAEAYKEEAHA